MKIGIVNLKWKPFAVLAKYISGVGDMQLPWLGYFCDKQTYVRAFILDFFNLINYINV